MLPTTNNHRVGDIVWAFAVDMVDIRGAIVGLEDGIVTIQTPKGEIELLPSQVRKCVSLYDHVKVLSGPYINQTGTVVSVTGYTVVVIADETCQEIVVRFWQLEETLVVETTQTILEGYGLHDLVQLSDWEVGMIVRVGVADCTILNRQSLLRKVQPEELRKKLHSHHNFAFDVEGTQLKVGRSIRVIDGPHEGTSGLVMGTSKSCVYVYSPAKADDAGIIVVHSRDTVTTTRPTSPAYIPTSRACIHPDPAYTLEPKQQRRRRWRNELVGKIVRVCTGKHRGLLGRVAQATPKHAIVELQARPTQVVMLRKHLVVVRDSRAW